MTNPKTAIDTILNTETEICEEIKVFPVTLARYALLELVESPFVTPDKKFSISNLLPSFYIMCAPKEMLKGISSKNLDKLTEQALDWAATIPSKAIDKLIPAIMEELGLIKKVSPNAGADEQGKEKGL